MLTAGLDQRDQIDVKHPADGFPCVASRCSHADVPSAVVCTVACTVEPGASVGTHTGVEGTKSLTRESPSGLMTASATKGRRPSNQIHCAIVSDECLRTSCQSHRLTRRRCRDGDKARGSAQSQGVQHSRPRILTQISADGNPHCTATDEHPRGHPCFFSFRRVWRSRSRGGACFSHRLTRRLSVRTSTHAEHLYTCRCMRNTCAHVVVHSFGGFPLMPFGLKVR